jgi:hypothetical protein
MPNPLFPYWKWWLAGYCGPPKYQNVRCYCFWYFGLRSHTNNIPHVKISNLSDPIEKFTDWDRFRSLASELISPKIEIKSGVEADKAASEFSASIASAYRLSTSKITLLDLNNELPGLDRLLRHKQRLRKLSQECWSHTSGCMADCEVPPHKGRTKGTNCYTWCFRLQISPVGESQRYCWLFGNSVHTTLAVWRKPWTAGSG